MAVPTPTAPLPVLIHGAAGRMGRRLVALTLENPALHLAGAMDATGHPLLGQDAGLLAAAPAAGVLLSDAWPQAFAGGVTIDFSLPVATRKLVPLCVEKHCPLVVGTTGLTAQDQAMLDEAARAIPLLQAANMSLGVNLLLSVAAQVAQTLGDDYDIEITETHHRFKKDAPSGTAMALAQAICAATGKSVEGDLVHGRHGHDVPRRRGSIGMHALRQGDVIGEHTVSFATLGERIALSHTATDRDVFVRGALRAAQWLAAQKPGRYTMKDVLGLA